MPATLELIRERASARAPFDMGRPVSEKDLAAILEAARWSPTAHNMQNFEIIVVDDRETLKAIEQLRRAPSEAFIRENYAQLSFTEEEWRRKKTGILGSTFPPEWLDPDFRLDKFSGAEIAAMQRPMPAAPCLLVVIYDPSRRAPASEGDFLGIMSLGCVMENMWLAAEGLGLGLQIVSSLGSSADVKSLLGIPEGLVVAFSCRLGHPIAKPPIRLRVRRDTDGFTHRNRFDA